MNTEEIIMIVNINFRNDGWEIDRKFVAVDWNERLGNGAFGTVYLGTIPYSLKSHQKRKSSETWKFSCTKSELLDLYI